MLPRLRAGDFDGARPRRDGAGRCGGDAGARPEARAGAPDRCRRGSARRAAALRPPRRQRGLGVAPLRPRSGLSRRPVDPHGRPAGGPDPGRRRLRPGRRIEQPGPHDGPARSRQPRRARVPPGIAPARPEEAGRDRDPAAGARPDDRALASSGTRPARWGRPRSSCATSSTASARGDGDGYIEPDDAPRVRGLGPGVRQGAREARRWPAAGSTRSRRRRSPAGRAGP